MLNKDIIYSYIKKIKKEDIFNYGINQDIELSDLEIDIIYDYIINRYNDIIDNPDDILLEVKDKLNIKTYNKLLELLNKYEYFIKKIQ